MVRFQILLILFVVIICNCSQSAFAQLWFKKGEHLCGARNAQEKPLLDAIKKADKLQLEKLLQKGGNPNTTDDCNIPVITYAAKMLRSDLLNILIKSGADVNAIDEFYYEPPLLWLIRAYETDSPPDNDTDKMYDSIKLLVDNGADVNLRGKSSDSALILAVLIQRPRIVELLIAAGAEVNFQNDENLTAYSYAAQSGAKDLKKILFKAGASLIIGVREYQAEYGENAFFQAAADGRTDIVEAMIAAGTDVNTVNAAGKMSALMRVTEDSTVDSLLDAGADVNLKDKAGFTAMIWAAAFRRESIVIKLIAAGADVNLRNNDGKSALDLINDLNFPSDSLTRTALIKAGAK